MPGKLRRLPWELQYSAAPRLASAGRRLLLAVTHGRTRVCFEGAVNLGPRFALNIPGNGRLVVGHGVDFRRGFYCEIADGGVVEIGAGSVFTGSAMIQCSTRITIGRRCAFGQAFFMADGNHRFRDHTRHLLDQGYNFRPITIGDGAVLMTKSTVLADVGERAVVGAHAVVTKPIPAYTVAVGIPARPVEYFGPEESAPQPAPADEPPDV